MIKIERVGGMLKTNIPEKKEHDHQKCASINCGLPRSRHTDHDYVEPQKAKTHQEIRQKRIEGLQSFTTKIADSWNSLKESTGDVAYAPIDLPTAQERAPNWEYATDKATTNEARTADWHNAIKASDMASTALSSMSS